ncbi:hypothetical protein GGR53DRAFT_516528 [Hypoxylon sp. FL1150]|nr:hypothetical protein GGR53DRAFT_516528 [Hypoxylon sp. FL1150]
MTTEASLRDYNILGIVPPATTKPISWESVKDDLKSFLRENPIPRARLAHVEGPHGSGKSTGMLEYIWSEIQSASEGTTVIYVPSWDVEALLLSAYFESHASKHWKLKEKTYVGLEGDIKSKLCFATARQLRMALRQENFQSMLPGHVTFLLDLEVEPTADGELLLSELCLWCRRRLSAKLDATTLITMATFSRPPLHDLLGEYLQTRCHCILMTHTGPSTGQPTSLSSRDLPLKPLSLSGDVADYQELIGKLMDMILRSTKPDAEPDAEERRAYKFLFEKKIARLGKPNSSAVCGLDAIVDVFNMTSTATKAPCVVFFEDRRADFEMLRVLDEMCKKNNVTFLRIRRSATLLDVVEAVLYPEPRFIRIAADFPFVLHLPRVAAIVSCGTTYGRVVFDIYEGQLVHMETPKSRMDFLKEQSYALKSNTGPKGIVFYAAADVLLNPSSDAHFDNRELLSGCLAYDEEVMRLSVEVCTSWPDPSPQRNGDHALIPLPAMSDTYLLRDMWRRLINMGCLRWADHTSKRPISNGPRTQRTLEVLDNAAVRWLVKDITVPLAYFLAGVSDATSIPTKRVMIRIAALIDAGTNFIKYQPSIEDDLKDAYNNLSHGVKKGTLEKIAGDCRGIGAQQFSHGSVWITLGLLLRQEDPAYTKEGGARNGEDTYAAEIEEIAFASISDKIRKIESSFGLGPCKDPIRDTQLQPSDIETVNLEMMHSWLHQTVFFRRTGAEAPTLATDLTSYERVEPRLLSSLVIRKRFEDDATEALFAFSPAHIFSRRSGAGIETHRVIFLTEIPKRLILNLLRQKGRGVCETIYPREARGQT